MKKNILVVFFLIVVQSLSAASEKINYVDSEGRTALLEAIDDEDFFKIKEIIKKGADVNLVGTYNYSGNNLPISPLGLAIEKYSIYSDREYIYGHAESKITMLKQLKSNYFEIIKLLVSKNAKIDNGEYTPLQIASRHGNLEMVKFLIDKGAKVNYKKDGENSALVFASYYGHFNVVKYLIPKGADLSLYGKNKETALYVAAEMNYIEDYKFRYNHHRESVDLTVKEKKYIKNLKINYFKIIKYLVEKGADVNQKCFENYTPLIAVCNSTGGERLEIVKYFVSKNADINNKTTEDTTALMDASAFGYSKTVKYLVKKGAIINAEDIYGRTPLSFAVSRGWINITKFLINNGADINHRDKEKSTILAIAALENRLEIVKLLIKKGANINAQDKNGDTILMNTISMGRVKVSKYLIDSGADISIKNKKNQTAMDLASKGNEKEIIEYLKLKKMQN